LVGAGAEVWTVRCGALLRYKEDGSWSGSPMPALPLLALGATPSGHVFAVGAGGTIVSRKPR
jgi:hypothetical protein